MEYLFPLLLGFALAIIATRLGKTRGSNELPVGIPLQSATTTDVAVDSLDQVHAMLEQAYQRLEHPRDLFECPEFETAAEALDRIVEDPEVLRSWCTGDRSMMTIVAIEVLIRRNDARVEDAVLDGIGGYRPWLRFMALSQLDRLHPAPEPWVHIFLAQCNPGWREEITLCFLREWVATRKQAGEEPPSGEAWTQWLLELNQPQLYVFANLLTDLGPSVSGPWLFDPTRIDEMREVSTIDEPVPTPGPHEMSEPSTSLMGVGRRWNKKHQTELDRGVDDPAHDALVERIERLLKDPRPRPVVLVGRPRTGKTELANRVLEKLLGDDWSVIQATPDQVNAGMKFVGEMEARVQKLANMIRSGRHTLWYAPDAHTMLSAGSVSGDSTRSIARAMRTDLQTRKVAVLGECSDAEWERATVDAPWLVDAFEVVRVPVPDEVATHQLVSRWLASLESGPAMDEVLLRETWELARQFLDEEQRPGNLFDTVKQAIEERSRASEHDPTRALTREDVLASISRRTGLPAALLDDRQHLDLSEVEQYFSQRVRGQAEAIECLLDRLAMIKTGVTDPSRPLGVFLFAGPTGTGKTELAKTLAEWMFGSAQRLIRVDMSEIKDAFSLDKILGARTSGETAGDSLVERVRRQPFSVVLLDEFEKASSEAWDLFLQVFDDGRLSDRRGRVADFRHCVILLTSNLGSRVETRAGVGFRTLAKGFREKNVREAIDQTFRPELLNRLDRVVVFRPLGRDVMREILVRQIEQVSRRRGLRERPWAVEWDEAALEFLLDRGFSLDLGARPLQRALERYLLAPLARTLAEQNEPGGDQFLFVHAAGDRLSIDFVDPDATDQPSYETVEPLGEHPTAIALDAHGTLEELAALAKSLDGIEQVVNESDWRRARDEELARTSDPNFWDSEERFVVLDRFQTRERIENATKGARSLLQRLGGADRHGIARAPLQKLALRLHVLEAAIEDLHAGKPGEVALLVREPVERLPHQGSSLASMRQIVAMYEGWARRRGARWRTLTTNGQPDSTWACVMQGFGVVSLLTPESGTHVFEEPTTDPSRLHRSTVIVDALPLAPVDVPGDDTADRALERLLREGRGDRKEVVRRYRRYPDPLVRDAVRGYRTGRLDRVLSGDFDLFRGGDENQAKA